MDWHCLMSASCKIDNPIQGLLEILQGQSSKDSLSSSRKPRNSVSLVLLMHVPQRWNMKYRDLEGCSCLLIVVLPLSSQTRLKNDLKSGRQPGGCRASERQPVNILAPREAN